MYATDESVCKRFCTLCMGFSNLHASLSSDIFIEGGDNMKTISDVLVMGAGITGCAVARELSGYYASVIVLEKENDLAEGATKANSGIVHAGYDAVPGSRKAVYNVRGASMYPDLCASLGLPYQQCGALVIALNEQDRQTVEIFLKMILNSTPGEIDDERQKRSKGKSQETRRAHDVRRKSFPAQI